jgi:uncharacterized membrane protein YhaH (DUF805 family)
MHISNLLFSFAGRLNRAPYWLASIAMIAAAAVLVGIAITIAGRSTMAIVIGGLVLLLMIWISLALTIKRLHDRNKSAWWVLLFYFAPSILQAVGHGVASAGVILPLIGLGISIWALVELGFLRGTTGPNSYGNDPLQIGWPA